MVCVLCVFFSSRRRHTRCALVTGVQTCALPISHAHRRYDFAGGLVVSWGILDVSPTYFAERLSAAVDIRHFWVGMAKVPVLAIVIAQIGRASCRERVCQYV